MKKFLLIIATLLLALSSFASIQYVDQNADTLTFNAVAGSYNISSSNDQFSISIDGGANQVFTLTHSATLAASAVCTTINSTVTGATCYVSRGFVRIYGTSANGHSSTILVNAPSNNANTALGIPAATYYGHSRCSATMTITTKQDIIDSIEAILTGLGAPAGCTNGVGWQTISGSGTGTLKLQSKVTPSAYGDLGFTMTVKDNSGTSVEIGIGNIQNTLNSTTSTTAGCTLLPAAGKIFKVIANPYGMSIFTASPTLVREACFVGTVALPSFLVGTITDMAWMDSNSRSEADTALKPSFRTTLSAVNTSTNGNYAVLLNSGMWQVNNATAGSAGILELLSFGPATTAGGMVPTAYQWHDGSALLFDALLSSGATAYTDLGLIRGQLWDSFIGGDAVAGDTVVSYTCPSGTCSALAITDNNVGTTGVARGTLFQVTLPAP
jgi:hypothetical protein